MTGFDIWGECVGNSEFWSFCPTQQTNPQTQTKSLCNVGEFAVETCEQDLIHAKATVWGV